MKTIIIGKNSSISKHVNKNLKNSFLLSANKLNEAVVTKIFKKYKKINLIFNNFYPSKNLNILNQNDYKNFVNYLLKKFHLFFKKFPPLK